MKNSNDTIGNQTRNLLVCSAVPQPTAPPRVLYKGYLSGFNVLLQSLPATAGIVSWIHCSHSPSAYHVIGRPNV